MADIKAAYKTDKAPRRVSRGSVSKPSDPRGAKLGRLVADATPRVVSRGSVSHPRG